MWSFFKSLIARAGQFFSDLVSAVGDTLNEMLTNSEPLAVVLKSGLDRYDDAYGWLARNADPIIALLRRRFGSVFTLGSRVRRAYLLIIDLLGGTDGLGPAAAPVN